MKVIGRMQRWALMYLLCLLLAVVLMLPQASAVRAWSGESTQNTAICTSSANQGDPQIISDGSGGAIITWEDGHSSDYDIYAQRVNSAGAVQWTANGVAMCTASGDQVYPRITSDGSGGAIITWMDQRSGTNSDIYAQRVDSSGAVQWTANGVAMCTASGDQVYPRITSDGSAGAIITWQDGRSGKYDVYAQRIDSAGAVQWTTNGVAICTAADDQLYSQITSDGSAGAIITWQDYRSGNYDVYAQRIDSAGAVQWTTNGAAICTDSDWQQSPQIISDGSGGAIITWLDLSVFSSLDIYAQRVNSSGVVQWTANGVAICTAADDQRSPQIISDATAGAIITWYDGRGGSNNDIYAQRVNSAGAVQWATNGVAIRTGFYDQLYPQITSDGSGGAIITWQDYRGVSYDAFAQRINSAGAVQWTANGVALCTASGDQLYPQITSDGSGGAIITWTDGRSGLTDIYAQRVHSGGSLPTPPTVTLTSTTTSPTKVSPVPVTATFSEEVTGFVVGDITVGNGTAGNFVAVTSALYTFDVIPSDVGAVTVNVAADVAQDAADDGNAAAQFSITYDTVAPTVTLTSTAASPPKVSPVPVTATFSEEVTGFVLGDVTVGNGTASNFMAVSAAVYTFDVTPAGQGTVTVNVAANVAQDAASNANAAATQYSITYDTLAPTVTLASIAASPTKTSPILMTATFSEVITGFAVGDITVGNGTAGNFVAVSTTVYTFDVTPSGQGAVTVNVAAAVAQDAALNYNTAATQYSITYDSVAPTVTLTSTATSPTSTSPIPMTATFSKTVTGFAVGDITVVNGTAGNFVAVSTTVYTFDLTPAEQGTVTVNVAANVAQDAALNGNTAATQHSITYDYDSLPTITSFTTSSTDEGDAVIITGTNFTGATAVKFGDMDALSFTVDSDTQITALVGSSSSGKVAVTTAGGSATSADDFTPPASSAASVNRWLAIGIVAGVVFSGVAAWWMIILRRRRKQGSA